MLHDDVHGDRVRWGSNRVRCVSATGPGVSVKSGQVRPQCWVPVHMQPHERSLEHPLAPAPIHARKLQSARMQTVTCTTFFG